jgi:hypothetical protein
MSRKRFSNKQALSSSSSLCNTHAALLFFSISREYLKKILPKKMNLKFDVMNLAR